MSVDQSKLFVKRQNTTRDAFLGGRLNLLQPEKGFRAGSDSVLLGASAPPTAARILDLGAGIGTAGLVASIWAERAEVLLAEREAEALALACDNVVHNHLSDRVRVIDIDLGASGRAREAAGLIPDSFDVVLANPPYFAKGRGTPAGESGRNEARHGESGGIASWIRIAAGVTVPRGEAIFILPVARLGEALGAFENRFGGLRLLPVSARPGAAAGRVMIRGKKGSRAALKLLPPLVLHEESGNGFAPESADILMGRRNLDW